MKTKFFYYIIVLLTIVQFSCKKDTIEQPAGNNTQTTPGNNEPPVANAGPDITITLPQNSVTLTGSGTDPGGSSLTFKWIWISGSSRSVIANPDQAQTAVNHLTVGVHQIQLTVTNNRGLIGKDTVVITVNFPPGTLYSDWFTVDSIFIDNSGGYSSIVGNKTLYPPLVYNAETHYALSYVKNITATGAAYGSSVFSLEVPDSSRATSYWFEAWLNYHQNSIQFPTGFFSIEVFPLVSFDPPESVILNAKAAIQSYQYRVILVPRSAFSSNSGINWDNYLDVVAALNITP